MTLLCTVMGHTPNTARHRNQGLEFSLCHHCGCDLIRFAQEGDWARVPAGFHVVWREFGRVDDAASVAQRMARMAPPRRREARGGRVAAHRDLRSRPLQGATAVLGTLAKLRELVCGDDASELVEAAQPAICLPHRAG